jgi:putative FmdB family regulatory protein
MPTYVYGCDACGHRFETFQKFSDAPLTECPECQSRIRRILQPAGIVFKGSGWHSTDYRPAAQKGSTESNGDTAGGEKATTSDGKGESTGSETPAKSETTTPAKAAKSEASE